MNNSFAHSKLVRDILAAFGAEPDLLLAINSAGMARHMSGAGNEFFVPYGWPGPGAPDLLGVLKPGRMLALECKTGRAVVSCDQLATHKALKSFGALVYVVRSVEDARQAIEDARKRVA